MNGSTGYAQNSLVLWGNHTTASVPYNTLTGTVSSGTLATASDPVAQYLGVTYAAHLNGSEQVYLPVKGQGWRPSTKIITYDPTQANVPASSDGPAVIIAYGKGLGDNNRGYVMMEAGHSINKGTAGDVPAQRAFFNWSFLSNMDKAAIKINSINGIPANGKVLSTQSYPIVANYNLLSSVTNAVVTWSCVRKDNGVNFGTFSPNGTTAAGNTTFTPDAVTGPVEVVITIRIADPCGRQSFLSQPAIVYPGPTPPVANNDFGTISGSCTPGTSETYNVLRNDTDPQGNALTLTSLNLASASPASAGVWSLTPDSSVTFTPDPNFNGVASIQYTITNALGATANATISITVGSTDANGCSSNQVYGPSEVSLIDLSNFVSQSGTGAALDGTALDDTEDTYSTAGTDYLNFGTNSGNNLILAIGSAAPLRAKDSINIYWSKGGNNPATISLQIGTTSTGPWTNLQTFTNSTSGTGSAVSTVSTYTIPAGVSGVTHIRLSAGTASPAANSSVNVFVDAIEFEYLSCVTKAPNMADDDVTVLEDAPAVIDVLANDNDPQGLGLTIKNIITQPTKGKVSINTDGTITYVSNYDVNGTDQFTYQACNAEGYCSTATVNVTITADGCGAGQYKAVSGGGSVTKIFQYQYSGANSAIANTTVTNFRDSWLDQANVTTNNGGTTKKTVEIGKTNQRRGVFYFDLSADIPTNAVVQSAVFGAYRTGGDKNSSISITAHALSSSWVENQVSWSNRSTGPTVAWSNAGGDFGSVLATTTVPSTNAFYFWNIGTSTVQNWVSTPSNNFGILLRQNGTSLDKRHQFIAKDETNSSKVANRP
ncbi:MAG: tandem-95 repeat protein, partial [Ferruginibacter sp.]|nr:tandem-95 repeat protein [Ferruginibacter sp.]